MAVDSDNMRRTIVTGFRELLAGSPVAIAVSRLADGMFVEANQAFLDLFCVPRDKVIGSNSQALHLWKSPAERRRMLARVKANGHVQNVVHEIPHGPGKAVRVTSSAYAIDLDGEPHLLVFLTRLNSPASTHSMQINDRERLRFVEQAAKIGFWDWDAATGYIDWSPGLEALYGMPEGSFSGSHADFAQWVLPADVSRYEGARDGAIATGAPFDLDFRIARADGQVRWLLARGAAQFGPDGTLMYASGINIDITDKKHLEQAVLLNTAIITNMAEGVNLVSAETGTIVFTNPRYDQMLGYASGELIGNHVSIVNANDDQDPVEVARTIIAELTRTGSWQGEVKNRRKDGSMIWFRTTVSSFDHANLGRVWVGVNSDITAERLAQQARDGAQADLRRLSANVQEAIEAERSALSRDIHDQVGSALTSIRMQLEAISRQMPAGGRWRDDLLNLAQLAQTTQLATRAICNRIRPPLLDDLGLANACRWYLRDWERSSGIRTSGRFPHLATGLAGNASTDLFRVFQELLTNVARHAGASSVRATLSVGEKALRLRVSDDGCGFPLHIKPAGFGLAGVRERAHRHRGEVAIESGPSGTTVTVSIPQEDNS